VVRFGYATDSYDRDGTPAPPSTEPMIDRAELETALESFRGLLQQTPPPVSAKKIGGTPAYKLARKNLPVELKPVEVTVHSLELAGLEGADAHLTRCSAGTYLRSIAHTGKMGCGAFSNSGAPLPRIHARPGTAARRTEQLAQEGCLEEVLIPTAQLLPQLPERIRRPGDRRPDPAGP
jgi:tRNA pseudouridine55 synthase